MCLCISLLADQPARKEGSKAPIMPADWPHVSGCRAGSDCVFYQDGKGKFDFKPIVPARSGK
jgi:hypothetical protein